MLKSAIPVALTTVVPLLTIATDTFPVCPLNGTVKWPIPVLLTVKLVAELLPICTVTVAGKLFINALTCMRSCSTAVTATLLCHGALPTVPPLEPVATGAFRYQKMTCSVVTVAEPYL